MLYLATKVLHLTNVSPKETLANCYCWISFPKDYQCYRGERGWFRQWEGLDITFVALPVKWSKRHTQENEKTVVEVAWSLLIHAANHTQCESEASNTQKKMRKQGQHWFWWLLFHRCLCLESTPEQKLGSDAVLILCFLLRLTTTVYCNIKWKK